MAGMVRRRAWLAGMAAAIALPAGGRAETAETLRARLAVPEGYRERFTYLGSFAVSADSGPGAKQMHVVYASPGATAGFRAAGRFADGTVLVKEVFATKAEDLTTGRVDQAGPLLGWFVMVKDGQGAVMNDPLWGEGWGWAWFEAGAPGRIATASYQEACLACHTPAKANDWLHIGGYPALR